MELFGFENDTPKVGHAFLLVANSPAAIVITNNIISINALQ